MQKRLSIRLPETTHRTIAEAAAADCRTISSFVLRAALEKAAQPLSPRAGRISKGNNSYNRNDPRRA